MNLGAFGNILKFALAGFTAFSFDFAGRVDFRDIERETVKKRMKGKQASSLEGLLVH